MAHPWYSISRREALVYAKERDVRQKMKEVTRHNSPIWQVADRAAFELNATFDRPY